MSTLDASYPSMDTQNVCPFMWTDAVCQLLDSLSSDAPCAPNDRDRGLPRPHLPQQSMLHREPYIPLAPQSWSLDFHGAPCAHTHLTTQCARMRQIRRKLHSWESLSTAHQELLLQVTD